jgi:hypothetical protein
MAVAYCKKNLKLTSIKSKLHIDRHLKGFIHSNEIKANDSQPN